MTMVAEGVAVRGVDVLVAAVGVLGENSVLEVWKKLAAVFHFCTADWLGIGPAYPLQQRVF